MIVMLLPLMSLHVQNENITHCCWIAQLLLWIISVGVFSYLSITIPLRAALCPWHPLVGTVLTTVCDPFRSFQVSPSRVRVSQIRRPSSHDRPR